MASITLNNSDPLICSYRLCRWIWLCTRMQSSGSCKFVGKFEQTWRKAVQSVLKAIENLCERQKLCASTCWRTHHWVLYVLRVTLDQVRCWFQVHDMISLNRLEQNSTQCLILSLPNIEHRDITERRIGVRLAPSSAVCLLVLRSESPREAGKIYAQAQAWTSIRFTSLYLWMKGSVNTLLWMKEL